jgi:uncharacterized protein (DUF1810 family)
MPENEFAGFLEAQNPVYNQVISELAQGRKETHWMWFIFPQLKGLGRSATAGRFALQSLEQARRYANHPVVGQRLRHCIQLVLNVPGHNLSEIFDYPDDLKFHSCVTLFAQAVPEEPLFTLALAKYFNGNRDNHTLALLGLED